MRVLVVNRTKERAEVLAYGHTMKGLIQEALDGQGKWRPIEVEFGGGGCAWGMRMLGLDPGHYWEVDAPRYAGSFKTKLRFRLRVLSPRGGVWSNEFEGAINPQQFELPKRH
jgi:hypothetical protein